MIEINDSNFEELVAGSSVPVLVDFWAPWCGPCKMISPIVDEIAAENEGKLLVGKCNVDEADELPVKFGIRNIPTLLFFKGGELRDRMVGAATKAQIIEKLNSIQ